MGQTSRSFATIFELKTYMADNDVASSAILSIDRNASGHINLLHDGDYDHASGTGGATVTVPAGATVQKITAFANGADGTITIDGGDPITVRTSGGFEDSPTGLVSPVGGAIDIVFSASMDYFVSWTL
jgi:hypothetical protein